MPARSQPVRSQAVSRFISLVVIGALGAGMSVAGASGAAASVTLVDEPVSLVNPLIGTDGKTNTFPGPTMPFGMMQWSPDTRKTNDDDRAVSKGSSYEYSKSEIKGFSFTHLSGVGCPALGDIPVLPTVGALDSNPSKTYVGFSHANEQAEVGEYEVTLDNGVKTELTDSVRSGIGRFTFPASTQSNLLLKLRGSWTTPVASTFAVVSSTEITASVTAGQFCWVPHDWQTDYTVNVHMTFDQPFTTHSTWGTATSGPDGAALTFDTTTNRTVTAKVAISYTSIANAKQNGLQELTGKSFEQIKAANRAAWGDALGQVEVGGGTTDEQVTFYTALYHALLHPNTFNDVNGQYRGFDGSTKTLSAGQDVQYANFSAWDTYRTQAQLLALLFPDQASDMMTSMLNTYDQVGRLPKWTMANGESYIMIGDPAAAVISSTYAFGARDFDVAKAFDAVVTQGRAATDASSRARPGHSEYLSRGYIPEIGNAFTDARTNNNMIYGCCNSYDQTSTLLEYTAADYSIAAFAKALGDDAVYQEFATRSQNWQNTFDSTVGLQRPKMGDGRWMTGFDPASATSFAEGSSLQYTPMVSHNIRGLIDAKGGNASYSAFLDTLLADVTNTTRNAADLNNEISIGIPWQYVYTSEPYKTQKVVRDIQKALYFNAPLGQLGNDDLGTMSAWYVWSMLGMYPETPGRPVLVLGSPTFPSTVLHLAGGKTLTIDAPHAAADSPYVQALTVNGTAQTKAWTTYDTLAQGGTWTYDLASTPNTAWGAAASDAPPSDSTGAAAGYVTTTPQYRMALTTGAVQTATFTLRNATQSAMTLQWTATAAGSVKVSPRSGTVAVPAGGTAEVPVSVTARASEGTGSVTLAASDGAVALPTTTLPVGVAPAGVAWPYFTDTAISSDGVKIFTGLDQSNRAFSQEALAAAGFGPGDTVTADGISYTRSAETDIPDSLVAAGQTIPIAVPAGSTRLGILGASNDVAKGSSGTMTITYSDQTQQQVPLVFADWSTSALTANKPASNTTAVTAAYRNTVFATKDAVGVNLLSYSVGLYAGKTPVSITLPTNNKIHVFGFGSSFQGATPATSLAPYVNAIGATTDGTTADSGMDGSKRTYSATALAALGLTSGATLTASDGVSYSWPANTSGMPDNVLANGQTIPVSLPADATKLGILGSAGYGDAGGAAGTVVVHYTDGSSQEAPVTLGDWTLGGSAHYSVPSGSVVAAQTTYRNNNGTNDSTATYLFSVAVPLQTGKTVASVTLPTSVSSGTSEVMHVFSLGSDGSYAQAKASTTTLASAESSSGDASVRLTATVAAAGLAPGDGEPSGVVEFREGSRTLASGTLVDGVASVLLPGDLSAGVHAIKAYYRGSAAVAVSQSASVDVTIVHPAVASTTVLTPLTVSLVEGNSASLTATVTAADLLPEGDLPTGTVELREGSRVLASGTLADGKVALGLPAGLTVGQHTLVAVYQGSTAVLPSTSVAVTVTVTAAGVSKANSATRLAAPARLAAGTVGTLTVTVTSPGRVPTGRVPTGRVPTGRVEIRSGSTVLATGTLSSGKAIIRLPAKSTGKPGGVRLTAVYLGSATVNGSSSPDASISVTKAKAKVKVKAVKKTLKKGRKARIAVTVSSTGQASGTVRLTYRGKTLRKVTVKPGKKTTVTLPKSFTARTGKHKVTVRYSGSATVVATSVTVKVTVRR